MGDRGVKPETALTLQVAAVKLSDALPKDIEQARDEEANQAALKRMAEDGRYHPLIQIIPEPLASKVEPWMLGYAFLHAKTRVAIHKTICFCLIPGNWAKSRQKMAVELGIPYQNILYWAKKWPYMWTVTAELSRWHAQAQFDRVLGATVDAAIYGDSRDRRLYLELLGHIKRNEPTGAEGTILFVNDSVPRPQAPEPKTIEASKVDAGGAPPEEAEASLINDTNKGEGSESDEL